MIIIVLVIMNKTYISLFERKISTQVYNTVQKHYNCGARVYNKKVILKKAKQLISYVLVHRL